MLNRCAIGRAAKAMGKKQRKTITPTLNIIKMATKQTLLFFLFPCLSHFVDAIIVDFPFFQFFETFIMWN